MNSDYPLVSCIMPTRGRPQFAREAVEAFLAQTWPAKELLIVDDDDAPSCPTTLSIPGIRQTRLFGHPTVGVKRNLAISMASGEIICHWDDDDVSAPGRIEDQIRRLAESGKQITGYSPLRFTDGRQSWLYVGLPGYAPGTTLMYHRDAWRARPFRELRVGEDNAFLDGRQVITAPAGDLMYARDHAGNTSPRQRAGSAQWVLIQ